MVDSLILLDARHEVGVIGGVIRVSQAVVLSSQFPVLSSIPKRRIAEVCGVFVRIGGWGRREKLEPQGAQRSTGETLKSLVGGRWRVLQKPYSVSVLKRLSRRGAGKKNAGLKAATLISVSNPVSQVLW